MTDCVSLLILVKDKHLADNGNSFVCPAAQTDNENSEWKDPIIVFIERTSLPISNKANQDSVVNKHQPCANNHHSKCHYGKDDEHDRKHSC